MALNMRVFQGVNIQQVRDAMNYSQYLKRDEEVEGIRLSKEEQEKYSSPVLLSVVTHNHDDERKSEPIQ
jgi:hypothetical protein